MKTNGTATGDVTNRLFNEGTVNRKIRGITEAEGTEKYLENLTEDEDLMRIVK